jgi:hypothetical protein
MFPQTVRTLKILMSTILLSSGREWEGFQPVPYWLDLGGPIAGLPLKVVEGQTETPTIVGHVYDKFEGKHITEQSFGEGVGLWFDLETTDGIKLRVGGPDFNLRLLLLMLQLRQEGINPFLVSWYFYEKSFCRTDAQVAYKFFLVHNGKIVREGVTFYDHHKSGFEPSVFGKQDHSDPTWSDEKATAEAWARYWYRKFYAETRTGQAMMLRPDHPELFFCEGEQGPDIMGAIGVIARSVNGIRFLLWVLVILSVLNLILRLK